MKRSGMTQPQGFGIAEDALREHFVRNDGKYFFHLLMIPNSLLITHYSLLITPYFMFIRLQQSLN